MPRKFFVFCICFLFYSNVFSQTLDLKFSTEIDCDNNQYLVTYQIKVAELGEFGNIGNSSILMNYNADALDYNSYQSINFDESDNCYFGVAPTWGPHGIDGLMDGSFNVTILINAILPEGADSMSCPTIYNDWIDIGRIVFDIENDELTSGLMFPEVDYAISFNSAIPNNGTEQLAEGNFSNLDEALTCAASVEPTATIEASVMDGPAELEVTFDGTQSFDSDGTIISWLWNFGDGNSSLDPNPTHIYETEGDYIVTLTVIDNDGLEGLSNVIIEVGPPMQAPIADCFVDFLEGFAPLTINADGSVSTDIDGSIISYQWNFGDGEGVLGASVSHTYMEPGIYQLELIVTDNDDLSDIHIVEIVVNAVEIPPVAQFSHSDISDFAPIEVSFDGSLSFDSDNEIVDFAWDFGDGNTGSGELQSHTFQNAGTFNVVLTVTDESNLSASVSQEIVVVDAPAEPTADIEVDFSSGTAPLAVNFNASNSNDPDGSIVQYDWDFADGTTGTGETLSHVFTEGGFYSVSLLVTDNSGMTAQAEITIVVDSPLPPTATITADPTEGLAPLPVSFDGSGSTDPDGSIVTYSWDLGDGTTSDEMTVEHTYTESGSYTVTLMVTDDQDLTSTTETTITVTSAASPTATITADPTEGLAPLPVSFDGSGSTDPDGSIVSYSWDLGDGTTSDEMTVEHIYTESGSYTVTLTVTDDQDLISTTEATITVTSAEEPTAVINADPTLGETPLPVSLDASDSSDPDGNLVEFNWDLGNGMTGSGETMDHTFTEVGEHMVILEVMDDQGMMDSDTLMIVVLETGLAPCDTIYNNIDLNSQEFLCSSNGVSLFELFGIVESPIYTSDGILVDNADDFDFTNSSCEIQLYQFYIQSSSFDITNCQYDVFTTDLLVSVSPETNLEYSITEDCGIEFQYNCSDFDLYFDGEIIDNSQVFYPDFSVSTSFFAIDNKGLCGPTSLSIEMDCIDETGCDSTPSICVEAGKTSSICPEFCNFESDDYIIISARTDYHCSISLLSDNCIAYEPLGVQDGTDTSLEIIACRQSSENTIECDTLIYEVVIGECSLNETSESCIKYEAFCTQPASSLDFCVEYCSDDKIMTHVSAGDLRPVQPLDNFCVRYTAVEGFGSGRDTVMVVACNQNQVCDTIYAIIEINDECDEDPFRLVDDNCYENLPNMFSPNNDGNNDVWKFNDQVNCQGNFEIELLIFDRMGQVVYQNISSHIGDLVWNGNFLDSEEKVSEGAYFYALRLKNENNLINRSGFIEVRY